MSDTVSNDVIYSTLLEIKEDIGGLKATTDLHLKALENFGPRIGVLEGAHERQKGAVKVWGLVATGAAALVGAAPTLAKLFRH